MENNEIKDRVTLVRQALKLSGRKFAMQLGYNPATLSTIENGLSAVTDRLIASICAKFNVNEEWLRTGKGEMFAPKPAPTDEADAVTNFLQSVIDDLSEKNRTIVLRVIKNLKRQNFFEENPEQGTD